VGDIAVAVCPMCAAEVPAGHGAADDESEE